MSLLRGIYHSGRAYWEKKGIEQTIRKFDMGVKLSGDFPGFAFHQGWVDVPEVSPPTEFDAHGIHISHRITAQLAQIAAPVIQRLKPTITTYLGADARLDDISMFSYCPSQARKPIVSGDWHDDNCGHRLKLFICLQGDGNTPTVLVPGSHRRPYKFRYEELLRFMAYGDKASRPGEVFLRYRTGDVALFDTHALHRGLYEEPATERTVILVEFMNRWKSNAIAGRAPCGPGSAPRAEVLMDQAAYAALADTGLIDGALITPQGDQVSYSLRHRQKEEATRERAAEINE
jgi:hypothetical protein